MVMALAFHTEDPYGVGDVLNIFLFPDLSPLTGSEAALLTHKWDSILGSGTLNSFTDTSLVMGKQRVAPISGWDKEESQLEAWAVFFTLFLEDDEVHPTTYNMFLLLQEKPGVRPRMRAQARQQPTFPRRPPSPHTVGVQREFPKGVGEAASGEFKNSKSLQRALAMSNFRP